MDLTLNFLRRLKKIQKNKINQGKLRFFSDVEVREAAYKPDLTGKLKFFNEGIAI